MGKVSVNVGDLIEAFDTHFDETAYYLDLKTGEILFVSEYDNIDNLKEKIENDSTGRYVYIKQISSPEGYRQMEDFIDMITDKNLQEKLEIAISGKGAFLRFKDVLISCPEERQRWFDFHEKAMRGYANEWVEDLNWGLKGDSKSMYGGTIVWVK